MKFQNNHHLFCMPTFRHNIYKNQWRWFVGKVFQSSLSKINNQKPGAPLENAIGSEHKILITTTLTHYNDVGDSDNDDNNRVSCCCASRRHFTSLAVIHDHETRILFEHLHVHGHHVQLSIIKP